MIMNVYLSVINSGDPKVDTLDLWYLMHSDRIMIEAVSMCQTTRVGGGGGVEPGRGC